MGLEDLTGSSKFIDDLVNTNPVGSTDTKSTLDDHIRGLKNVLLNTFPNVDGAINFTPTEANVLAGVTAGTSAASKAVVLDGSSKIDALDITSLTLNGTAVTATAAELNYNDVTSAGTAEASKAVILDASKDVTGINALGATSLTQGGNNVLDDGTTITVSQGGTGVTAIPSFSSYMAAQSFTAPSSAVLQFAFENFDTNSDFDTGTYRFTPTVAGKYLIHINAEVDSGVNSPSVGGTIKLTLRKNGTAQVSHIMTFQGTDPYEETLLVSGIVDMNGTSDYIDAFFACTNSGDLDVGNNFAQSQFSAVWVAP